MRCPSCKSHDHSGIDLHADGFSEGIHKCRICGTIWSLNHGVTEIVQDPQKESFLQAQTECVEGDDYNLPGDK